MEFEVTLDRYGACEWKWTLFEVDSDGKRTNLRQRGFQPFKSWAVLAAKWEARRIRKQKEWRTQNFSKRI